jgi:hypothetical protein
MTTSYFPPSVHNGKTLETWNYTNENYTQVSATYVGDVDMHCESESETIVIDVT